jgi:hypothetical protein
MLVQQTGSAQGTPDATESGTNNQNVLCHGFFLKAKSRTMSHDPSDALSVFSRREKGSSHLQQRGWVTVTNPKSNVCHPTGQKTLNYRHNSR